MGHAVQFPDKVGKYPAVQTAHVVDDAQVTHRAIEQVPQVFPLIMYPGTQDRHTVASAPEQSKHGL